MSDIQAVFPSFAFVGACLRVWIVFVFHMTCIFRSVMCVCVCVCVCVRARVCVCVCVSVYVYCVEDLINFVTYKPYS